MIYYKDYLDNCFTLNGSVEPTNFIRSRFDFGTRQRRVLKGYVFYGVRLVLEHYELMNFKTFWSDLGEGTDSFYSDAHIHGDTSYNKILRFTKGYSLKELGKMKYELICEVEMISTGDTAQRCPLVPLEWLVPTETLLPC